MAQFPSSPVPVSPVVPEIPTSLVPDIPDSQPLMPVLFAAVTCPILITLAAYILGAYRIINANSAQGLNEIVAKLLLPCLLLKAMLTLDLSEVRWSIIAVITVAKLLLMAFTCGIVHVFISRQRLGKLGLYGIFVTMSNDIAVGLPIIQVLFPKFQNYIFLVKPPQMLLLNGIGLALLELAHVTQECRSRVRADRCSSPDAQQPQTAEGQISPLVPPSDASLTLSSSEALRIVIPEVAWRLVKNPAVNTVFIGLFINAMFGPTAMPQFVLGPLQVAGDAFSSCALATLGLSLVGKESVILGRGLTWPFVLATLKSVALPFLTHAVAQFITHDKELLEFFFVYGAIPSSPPAFTFAAEYGVAPDTIAASLVVTLFMSTLVMLAGTFRMQTSNDLLSQDISEVSRWMAVISTVVLLPMILAFVSMHRSSNSPAKWLPWLLFSEMCFSVMHLGCLANQSASFAIIIQALHEFFRVQTSVWICCLALCLLLTVRGQTRSLQSWAPYFHIVAWGVPAALLAPVFPTLGAASDILPCIMRPGLQGVTSIIILSVCLIINVRCLMLAHLHAASSEHCPPDIRTPLRRRSTGSLRYWSMRLKAESLSRLHADATVSFMFRVRIIIVCEVINLAFQILGELRFLQSQNHFFLPFLFGMLLEQGQPILLFLVFGLQDNVIDYCYSHVRALARCFSWNCCSTVEQEESVPSNYSTASHIPSDDKMQWPELGYDELVAMLSHLTPLLHDIHEYNRCFLGNEAVDALVQSNQAQNRAHAVAIGQQMVAYELISHVRLERDFEDRPTPYRPTDLIDAMCPQT